MGVSNEKRCKTPPFGRKQITNIIIYLMVTHFYKKEKNNLSFFILVLFIFIFFVVL